MGPVAVLGSSLDSLPWDGDVGVDVKAGFFVWLGGLDIGKVVVRGCPSFFNYLPWERLFANDSLTLNWALSWHIWWLIYWSLLHVSIPLECFNRIYWWYESIVSIAKTFESASALILSLWFGIYFTLKKSPCIYVTKVWNPVFHSQTKIGHRVAINKLM